MDEQVTLGESLARLQHYLAEEWNDSGPEHVAALLAGYDDTTRTNLLMANIGQTAAFLT